MERLKLKKEYEGLIITKNVLGLGQVTFDPSKVDPINYENYSKMGFEELFEKVIDNVVELIVEDVEDVNENIVEKRKTKRQSKTK